MGAKIYAETCPHYLTLTKDTSAGVLATMAPPLREEMDTQSLWQAVSDGSMDIIASDHVLRSRREKEDAGDMERISGSGWSRSHLAPHDDRGCE